MKNELITKYNIPVPRYTSYPPANYFHTDFTATDYLQAIEESNHQQPATLSFYIHIPYCKHLCFYCGCNSFAMACNEEIERYIGAVKKEIELVCQRIDKTRKISQIHYGGGSPTAIPVHYLKEINDLLLSKFNCVDNPEIAIECHPGYLDKAAWIALTQAGFNRFSIGIQDLNEQVLKTANRRKSLLPPAEIFEILRAANAGVNMDFIYGLPHQTVESFTETLRRAIALKPDRIVTFSYAHVPWVNKLQLQLEKAGLPSAQEKSAIFDAAKQLLEEAGYKSIGLDHFVLPNDALHRAAQNHELHRNFQGYCTRETTGQVYAFGVTGISQLASAYAQNTKSIAEYIATVEDGKLPICKGYRLTTDEQLTREVITSLMCNNRLNWQKLAQQLHVTAQQLKAATAYSETALTELATDGIIAYNDEEITMHPEQLVFLRNVAASLDKLMINNSKSFSKPV